MPHSVGHWWLWNRRVTGVCQAASFVGMAGPSPSRTQPPGPKDTFPHLDFSPVASLLLTQLHKPGRNTPSVTASLLETGADGGRGGGRKPGYVWQSRRQSLVREMFLCLSFEEC